MRTDARTRSAVEFPNGDLTDTILSGMLSPSHTYTLIVYRLLGTPQCDAPPCTQVINLGYPQVHEGSGWNSVTFPSPLNGALVGSGRKHAPIWQFVQNMGPGVGDVRGTIAP